MMPGLKSPEHSWAVCLGQHWWSASAASEETRIGKAKSLRAELTMTMVTVIIE